MGCIIVCDTNIYISSLISASGPPDEVITLARRKEIEVAISLPILSEIEKVLRDKLLVPQTTTYRVIAEIKNFSTVVDPKVSLLVIREKDSDNRILECAVEAKADYIVTGDTRHLQVLKKFQGIPILSPAQFLVKKAAISI